MAVFTLPGLTGPILQRGIEVKDAELAITSGFVFKRIVLSQPDRFVARVIRFDHLSLVALMAKPDRDISRFVFPILAHSPYIREGVTDSSGGGGISIY
jgi:hypothetical protein